MEKPKPVIDEFERRMHFSSVVTTLADVLSKTSPSVLVSESMRQDIESAGLKDQFQNACKRWLDMYIDYIEKIRKLGKDYPIESLLGIEGTTIA